MDTAVMGPRLEVADLEFVPARQYAAIHGCGNVITAKGTEMKKELDRHTAGCEWSEPTA